MGIVSLTYELLVRVQCRLFYDVHLTAAQKSRLRRVEAYLIARDQRG